jgi:hypothetical protein
MHTCIKVDDFTARILVENRLQGCRIIRRTVTLRPKRFDAENCRDRSEINLNAM